MLLTRRALFHALPAAGLALARSAAADALRADLAEAGVEVRDLREGGRRFTLVKPRHLPADRPAPLALLPHGLGETGNERAGAFAWIELYGLLSSYARLRRPPFAATQARGYLTSDRARELTAELAASPFAGLVLACPHMPNVSGDRAATARYAHWLVHSLVPRARLEAKVHPGDERVGLAGCSLGGAVALDVLLLHPTRFGAVSGVQTAIGEASAPAYAAKLAAVPGLAVGPRARVQLVSSLGDPYLRPTRALARELAKRGVRHELRVAPGPHDQPWLREIGTLEALRFLDGALA